MLDVNLLGRMISEIGQTGFDSAFFGLARRTLDISSCSVFSFEQNSIPYPIILEGNSKEQRSRTKALGASYARNGYRNDPQIREIFLMSDLKVRLTNLAEIGDAAFRDHYYSKPRIGSEIIIFGRYKHKRYHIGLYRSTAKHPFDKKALEYARELAAVALPALHRHVGLLIADPQKDEMDDSKILGHLAAVLMADCNKISPREAEVCAAIILGYRTLAISLNMGISENTICTHRKRAYAKLGISSQNELFSLYFRTAARLGARGYIVPRPLPLNSIAA